ncbi:MAG: hypothetical protein Q9159_003436 [Coniocarpon cinnabarinum]
MASDDVARPTQSGSIVNQPLPPLAYDEDLFTRRDVQVEIVVPQRRFDTKRSMTTRILDAPGSRDLNTILTGRYHWVPTFDRHFRSRTVELYQGPHARFAQRNTEALLRLRTPRDPAQPAEVTGPQWGTIGIRALDHEPGWRSSPEYAQALTDVAPFSQHLYASSDFGSRFPLATRYIYNGEQRHQRICICHSRGTPMMREMRFERESNDSPARFVGVVHRGCMLSWIMMIVVYLFVRFQYEERFGLGRIGTPDEERHAAEEERRAVEARRAVEERRAVKKRRAEEARQRGQSG